MFTFCTCGPRTYITCYVCFGGPRAYLKLTFAPHSVATCIFRFHHVMVFHHVKVENKSFPPSSPPLVTWGWNYCYIPPQGGIFPPFSVTVYQRENCLKTTNCACRRCDMSSSPTAWFTQNGWASVVDSTADFLNSAQLCQSITGNDGFLTKSLLTKRLCSTLKTWQGENDGYLWNN